MRARPHVRSSNREHAERIPRCGFAAKSSRKLIAWVAHGDQSIRLLYRHGMDNRISWMNLFGCRIQESPSSPRHPVSGFRDGDSALASIARSTSNASLNFVRALPWKLEPVWRCESRARRERCPFDSCIAPKMENPSSRMGFPGMGDTRVELVTPSVSYWCSSQLS